MNKKTLTHKTIKAPCLELQNIQVGVNCLTDILRHLTGTGQKPPRWVRGKLEEVRILDLSRPVGTIRMTLALSSLILLRTFKSNGIGRYA